MNAHKREESQVLTPNSDLLAYLLTQIKSTSKHHSKQQYYIVTLVHFFRTQFLNIINLWCTISVYIVEVFFPRDLC